MERRTVDDIKGRERKLRQDMQLQVFRPTDALMADGPMEPIIGVGIPEIDEILGGGYRKGLHLLAGYSHNGKTQLLMNMIANNRNVAGVMISPDEAVDDIVVKLLAIACEEPQDDVIEKSAKWRRGKFRELFPKVHISDANLLTSGIESYIKEAEHFMDEGLRWIAYDYLGRLRGPGCTEDMGSKAQWFKTLGQDKNLAVMCLHQGNRSGAGQGQALTMQALAYGGEAEATTIIGVRRQFFNPELNRLERAHEQDHPTCHISVLKNKQRFRHGLTDPDGIQFTIEPDTGIIRAMKDEEQFKQTAASIARRLSRRDDDDEDESGEYRHDPRLGRERD